MNQRYTHRDRKFLDLAHGLTSCQIGIPGVCTGYAPNGCEPAHSNLQRHGRGASFKSHDIYHAAACHACHQEIDHGKNLTREQREDYWQRGFERTMLEYVRRGWLGVTG
jgi:hypothetical protein